MFYLKLSNNILLWGPSNMVMVDETWWMVNKKKTHAEKMTQANKDETLHLMRVEKAQCKQLVTN